MSRYETQAATQRDPDRLACSGYIQDIVAAIVAESVPYRFPLKLQQLTTFLLCDRAALEAQLAGMESKLLQGEAQGGLHVLARRQEDLLHAQQQELQQRRNKVCSLCA